MTTCVNATPFYDMTCIEQCKSLLDAYHLLITGKQRVRIAYANYNVEYKPGQQGDLKALVQLYTTIRNSCQEAINTLPDLSPGASVRRGPPVFGQMGRG